MKRAMLILFAESLLVVLGFGVVSAHAQIDHCTPAVSSVVTTAPTQVVCVMTETIDSKLSTIRVLNASNAPVDNKDGHVDLNDPDHKTLVVTLNASLMTNGVYTVVYHTITPDDGGITDGQFQFTVGSGPTPGPTQLVLTDASGAPTGTPNATAVATMASPSATAPAPTTAPTTAPTPSTLPTTGGETNNAFVWLGASALIVIAFGLATLRFAKRWQVS